MEVAPSATELIRGRAFGVVATANPAPSNSSPIPEMGTPFGSINPRPYSARYPDTLLYAATYDSGRSTVFIANYSSPALSNCSVIGIQGTKIVSELPTNWCAQTLAYDPFDGYTYAMCIAPNSTSNGLDEIFVLNGNSIVGNITSPSLLDAPCDAAFDPLDDRLYVTNDDSNFIDVINGTTIERTIFTNKSQNGGILAFDSAAGLLYEAIGNSLYSLNHTGILGRIGGTNSSGGAEFSGAAGAFYDPVDSDLYVLDEGGSPAFVTVVNGSETAGSSVIATINTPSPGLGLHGGGVDPVNGLFYGETDNSAQFFIVSGAKVVESSFKIGPLGYPFEMTFDSANGAMYVLNKGPQNVTPLSTELGIGPSHVDSDDGGADQGTNTTITAELWAIGDGRDTGTVSVVPSTGFACPETPFAVSISNLSVPINVPCNPSRDGTYSVWINVTDGLNNTVWSKTTVQVYSAPGVTPIEASRTSLDLGQSLQLGLAAYSGDGEFEYRWSNLPAGCASQGASLDCVPSTTGTFSIWATVTDGNGASVMTPTTTVTVDSDPTVTISGPSDVDQGEWFEVEANASGGSGGYTFGWTQLPTGCASVPGPTLSCQITGPIGETRFALSVFDSNGVQALSPPKTVDVLLAPFIGSPTFSPSQTDVGRAVDVSATGGGGYGPLTYAWFGLPAGLSASGANASGYAQVSGTFEVWVTLRDSLGLTISSPAVPLTINPSPVAAVLASSNSLAAGGSVLLQGVAWGGTGTLTDHWSFGDGLGAAGSAVTHQFLFPGVYTTTLWVNDSIGASTTASEVIVVVASAPPPPPPRVSPSLFGVPLGLAVDLIGLGMATLGLATAFVIVAVRIRERTHPEGNRERGSASAPRESEPPDQSGP